jgi:phosphoribosylformylglycinamidine cyclo-ligase
MKEKTVKKETYASAGVNIDIATQIKRVIAKQAQSTYGPQVLSGVGFFGSLFEFKGYKQPVLVASTDSVGTKVKLAAALEKYDTIGIDIVNHCVNDIFTTGADPLFFLDYIAMGKLVPEHIEEITLGLAKACRDVGCALIGGETAELPGIYSGNNLDLVGFILGVVEKADIMVGQDITAGDIIIGLPSIGLHTNGYSLARKVFGESRSALQKHYDELGKTLGEALLEPHRCYYKQLKPLLPLIAGIAHITGGSFYKNIPRILPDDVAAQLHSKQWTVPPLFELIQKKGNIEQNEMYHVFNMGIGMVVICSPGTFRQLTEALPEAKFIGEVVTRLGEEKLLIK